ncbi:hypothetical protein FHR24_002402 [Wenyingzhuangia heitensis]|uniref:GH16 domain-containing protein n=1 Tax=Wenyingzhuangia heitensis TaxID=1487859 RepID=A0ABX0UFI1_9FLAO|nr:hypothetical protein [Wenyingzhuangia heitensis]NIJ45931.1 hypothetical protein [Wenyingzhuangia heitensis]
MNMNYFAFVGCLLISVCAKAQTPKELPNKNGEQYTTYRDNSVSDEFNSNSLDTNKWSRRNSGGASIQNYDTDESLVVIEKDADGTQYISIKASAPNGVPKTAGIVNKASAFYGFYTVRFRFRGFNTSDVKEKGSIWHPSVWCGVTNHHSDDKRKSTKSKFWTEIDFMEWENGANGWSSDAPARLTDSYRKTRKVVTKGKDAEKAIMTKGPFKTYAPEWQTLGLEYTPEYIKLWQWKNGKWEHIGERVVHFVEEDVTTPEKKYTLSTIGKNARQPTFWVLGNIVAGYILKKVEEGTTTHTMNDLATDFDFFRYYRHNSILDEDWLWENGVRNGGGKELKDTSFIEAIKK